MYVSATGEHWTVDMAPSFRGPPSNALACSPALPNRIPVSFSRAPPSPVFRGRWEWSELRRLLEQSRGRGPHPHKFILKHDFRTDDYVATKQHKIQALTRTKVRQIRELCTFLGSFISYWWLQNLFFPGQLVQPQPLHFERELVAMPISSGKNAAVPASTSICIPISSHYSIFGYM